MFDRIDGERAVSACEEAVAAEPNNLRLAYQLGRALARVERTEEAVPQLRRAADAGGVAAMYALGDLLVYHDGGKSNAAAEGVTWIRRAADAGFVPALVGLATLYAEGRGVTRDDATADDYYRRAAETGNPYAQLQAGLRLDDRAGGDAAQLAEAERLLRAAAAQGWRDSYNELAWFLYTRNRDLAEAERFARRAVAAYPEEPASADTLGAILLRRGQAAEALVYLEFAASSEDDNPDYAERHGDALWALDRRDEAREAWNEALSNTQSDTQRQRLRERIGRQ
jgi:TPR repeat protein